ncbi:hypothetical protein EV702DRAFT_1200412 [Suillus placidus]|uniref:Uncharacterized protein n=1 Tax=Suillus placidus TaxID=48579 RepID=A0A9P6ZPL6_9AGAM|nr:hypothetical protein EV702DRAFT_1200412 [Suillus placidus]
MGLGSCQWNPMSNPSIDALATSLVAWGHVTVDGTLKRRQIIDLRLARILISAQEISRSLYVVTLSLDEDVRLFTNPNAEREKYKLLGTLYEILVALDYLKRAYIRDVMITAGQ